MAPCSPISAAYAIVKFCCKLYHIPLLVSLSMKVSLIIPPAYEELLFTAYWHTVQHSIVLSTIGQAMDTTLEHAYSNTGHVSLKTLQFPDDIMGRSEVFPKSDHERIQYIIKYDSI